MKKSTSSLLSEKNSHNFDEFDSNETKLNDLRSSDRVIKNSFDHNESNHEALELNESTNTWNLAQTTSKSHRNESNLRKRSKNFRFYLKKFRYYLKPDNLKDFRFKIILIILFLTILSISIFIRYLHYDLLIRRAINDQFVIYEKSKKLVFLNENGEDLLQAYYGRNIPDDIKSVNCRTAEMNNKLCFDWMYRARLTVQFKRELLIDFDGNNKTITCYNFKWLTYQKYSKIKDCFDLSDAHWFGLGDIHNLRLPLNRLNVEEMPFVTNHNESIELSGSIISRTLISSKGLMINVPLNVPLFLSINSKMDPGKICLLSQKKFPYLTENLNDYYAHLDYTVCLAKNINVLHNYFYGNQQKTQYLKKYLQSSSSASSLSSLSSSSAVAAAAVQNENIFLERIIWSTNPNVLPNFTQQNVQSYADQITNYGFGGIILLDSRWENTIGEMKMNETLFNNPKALINILHNKGFKIMLTVSPNQAFDASTIAECDDYILKDSHLQTPLLIKCTIDEQRMCLLIDFRKMKNRQRFRKNLKQKLLDSSGLSIDGIYFDNLLSSQLPRQVNYNDAINLDEFIENMNTLMKTLPTSLGLTSSITSINLQGYVRLHPRESSWEGLASIIPSVISLGLVGYPLVNTGIVGGRDLFGKIKNQTEYIDTELYLRWLEVIIFMPVVEFAELPGLNDLDVIKVAKRLLKVRNEHFVEKMKQALLEPEDTLIVRPMWWRQNESEAYQIEDQFMIGNDIVVAPIIHKGKTERDIYLPDGWWKDEILAQVIRGGKRIKKYQIPLDKVAIFFRTEPSSPPSSTASTLK